MTDEAKVDEIFNNHKIDGVIHFADLKAVGKSVSKPLEYYYDNLVSTMVLSKMCVNHGVNKFFCSSSETVYGDQYSSLKEDMELKKTINPYGETKAMSERILTDISSVNPNFSGSLLRYFNPIGVHESGLIWEDPNGIPNNLIPFVTTVEKGQLKKLNVFGNDYDTVDGTGVRDYIYNLGTGRETSVLELVNAFMKGNKIYVQYEIVGRRSGNIANFYANAEKSVVELGWRAERTIEDMVRDAWIFEENNK